MVSSPMSFLRDWFSFVRVLTALSLTFLDKADLSDFANDSLQRVNVIRLMLCMPYSSVRVMCMFIDYMMIRTFSSGIRFGFFIDKSTSEEVKFVTLEMLSFYGIRSNLDHITQIYVVKFLQYYLSCTDVIFFQIIQMFMQPNDDFIHIKYVYRYFI